MPYKKYYLNFLETVFKAHDAGKEVFEEGEVNLVCHVSFPKELVVVEVRIVLLKKRVLH